MNKILYVLLNRKFEYHKNMPVEECYRLLKEKCNNNYSNSKRSALALIETPFFERADSEYSFSIGHRSGGRRCEIMGDIEEIDGCSIVKIQIENVFLAWILLFIPLSLILFFVRDGGVAIILLLGLLIYIVWWTIASLYFLRCFEGILDEL